MEKIVKINYAPDTVIVTEENGIMFFNLDGEGIDMYFKEINNKNLQCLELLSAKEKEFVISKLN